MIIPDTSSILLLISGILNVLFNFSKDTIISCILGMILGFGILFVINFVFELITKTEGFGFGDMKLLGSIGLLVGVKSIVVIFFESIIISSIVGVVYIIYKKMMQKRKGEKTSKKLIDTYLPFGPAIIISTIITLVIPSTIVINFVDYLITIIVNKMI